MMSQFQIRKVLFAMTAIVLLTTTFLYYAVLSDNKTTRAIVAKKEKFVAKKEQFLSTTAELSPREKLWYEIENKLKNEPVIGQKLPGVIGIGVEKCGTHALMEFLRPHPLILVPPDIEMHYFDNDNLYDPKSVSKYIEMMPWTSQSTVVFEKTPGYFTFPPFDLPRRIKTDVPNAKLLLVLCEPSARVLSDFYQEWALYNISKQQAGKNMGFFKTIDSYLTFYLKRYNGFSICHEDTKTKLVDAANVINKHWQDYMSTILTTGLYDLHMKRWSQYYNSSNLMVVDAGDLYTNPGEVVDKVQDFLNIPKLLLKEDYVRDPNTSFYYYKDWKTGELKHFEGGKHRTRGVVKLDPTIEKTVKQFYKCHNEELYKELGYRLSWD